MAMEAASSDSHLKQLVGGAAPDKLVVVQYTASWCGPCQAIAPRLEELSGEHPDVDFVKVDIDACQDAAAEAGVRGVPTFHLVRANEKIAELVGAQPAALEELIGEHNK